MTHTVDDEPTFRGDDTGALSLTEGDVDPRRSARRPSRAWWVPPLVLLLLAGGVGYYFWHQYATPPKLPPTTTAPEAPAAPATPADADAVRHPIEEAQSAEAPPAPLPPLAESDAAMQEALAGLFRGDAFAKLFRHEDIVHRFVATIDNLPRATSAQRLMPMQPVPGAFTVSGREGNLVIAAENANRYTPYIRALEAVDTPKLVSTYVRFYPLFQEAYQQLGYPKSYFNDRLVATIDLLLAAPEPTGAIRLVQPKVLYEFADPTLEALPAGQKMMLRMGLANEARVKAKLREIRKALTAKRATP